MTTRTEDSDPEGGLERENTPRNADRTGDSVACGRSVNLRLVGRRRSRIRRANVRGLVGAGGRCVVMGEGRQTNYCGDQEKKEDLHSHTSCCMACLTIRTRRLEPRFISAAACPLRRKACRPNTSRSEGQRKRKRRYKD